MPPSAPKEAHTCPPDSKETDVNCGACMREAVMSTPDPEWVEEMKELAEEA
jgi:hypothetical protein